MFRINVRTEMLKIGFAIWRFGTQNRRRFRFGFGTQKKVCVPTSGED
ncbi:hypothetical protein E2C01_051177 [Portunus trituberculatus]|uniref:Uncharacterized protein n=1 Tax=Portunus trituberculatus TaxID=210409 RepID=A0A5B7GE25_PORTR|nr:hypothetical protein [Portunus trituberculatus]